MTSPADLIMLMRYSAWANDRLYAALMPLSTDLLQQPRPGRPAGLIGVLGHILVVDWIWRAHLTGQAHGLRSRTLEQAMPIEQLRQAQADADQWFIAHAEGQEAAGAAPEEVVHFHFVDGGPGAMTRTAILLHVANHKTYHRGYVADMLYDTGLRPPTMDLPVFLRDAAPASA